MNIAATIYSTIYSGPFQLAVCSVGHMIVYGQPCPHCPPDGMVACPADAPHATCGLCHGTSWVEELKEE